MYRLEINDPGCFLPNMTEGRHSQLRKKLHRL